MASARELSGPFPEFCASPQYSYPVTQGSQAAGIISPSTQGALRSFVFFFNALLPFEGLAVILLCIPQKKLNSHWLLRDQKG